MASEGNANAADQESTGPISSTNVDRQSTAELAADTVGDHPVVNLEVGNLCYSVSISAAYQTYFS